MVTLDALQAALEADGDALSLLAPVEAALADLPQLDITSDQAIRLRNGNPVLLRGRDAPVEEEAVGVFERGRLIAIAKVEHGELKPVRLILPD
jgi:tRNA pseudouridine55 synthase